MDSGSNSTNSVGRSCYQRKNKTFLCRKYLSENQINWFIQKMSFRLIYPRCSFSDKPNLNFS